MLVSELLIVGWLLPPVISDIHKIMGVCCNLILLRFPDFPDFWNIALAFRVVCKLDIICRTTKSQDGAIGATEEN